MSKIVRNLPPRVKAHYKLARLRRKAKTNRKKLTFVQFVNRVKPNYKWYPAMQRLAAVLQRIADGDLNRLMVFMPPRHGKSELISRLFSAYYLYVHEDRFVGLNSYSADLAHTFSRAARDNFRNAGGAIKGDTASVKQWETNAGGGFWAAGVGGAITGKGFHLGIIDDPVKNAEEAGSLKIQQRNRDWYDSTFSTREEPGGAVIIIMTRWNVRDLAGYVIGLESEEPESWHVVNYEAIKTAGDPKFPPTFTTEPDSREEGEALVPERYSVKKLLKFKRRLGSYFFGALFQQSPTLREGGMFKRKWFPIAESFPSHGAKVVRYWDKAGTEGAGDYTAGVLMAVVNKNEYYILDVIMGQWGAAQREAIIERTAVSDNARYPQVRTYIEQEGGSGGKESAEATIKRNAGYSFKADLPRGDKVLRAEPVASQASILNVRLLRGDWNERFLDILAAFPNGDIRDPVDAMSGAFKYVAKGGGVGQGKY